MGKRQADDGEDFTSPKVKKAKAGKADKAAAGKVKASKSPKAEAPKSGGPVGLVKGEDAEGVPFWEIGKNRRVTISKFKGITLVNIREYYEANNEMKPGKKGISLTVDQFEGLLDAMPDLVRALTAEGFDLSFPESAVSDGGGAPVAVTPKKTPKKFKKEKSNKEKSKKANIEETSDEESDDEDEE